MVTLSLGKHTVEIFDTIDELPIVRFHKYQKLLLVDAGIGSDISAFDQRLEKVQRYLSSGKPDKAQQELENLRQSVYFIQSEISPRHRAFAALVAKIDGKETEMSDDGLSRITEILADVPETTLADALGEVKKKIDSELMVYFPRLFEDSTVKEYFDLWRKRVLLILEGIVAGVKDPDTTPEVEKITTALVTYSNPQKFAGPESAEIVFDRQFENLCLVLSEQLHLKPKECTVLEFYNAFDFLQERARKAEKGQKRPYLGR